MYVYVPHIQKRTMPCATVMNMVSGPVFASLPDAKGWVEDHLDDTCSDSPPVSELSWEDDFNGGAKQLYNPWGNSSTPSPAWITRHAFVQA